MPDEPDRAGQLSKTALVPKRVAPERRRIGMIAKANHVKQAGGTSLIARTAGSAHGGCRVKARKAPPPSTQTWQPPSQS